MAMPKKIRLNLSGDARIKCDNSGKDKTDGEDGSRGDLNLGEADENLSRAVRLSPEELTYIQEGNVNVVCGYHGNREDWENMVLRCRKGDNSTCRRDCKFANIVAAQMFGSEYVEAGELIGVHSDDMVAIDEAIFNSRPEKRRTKRLDTIIRDRCGHILAQKVPNLMAAPVGTQVVTVELKPKCGVRDRPGLPSRYALLQYEKLKTGKIDKFSNYDPIKLLSGDRSLIREALQACIEEPQNNLRIFIDGSQVLSDDALKKSDRATVLKKMDELLKDGNFGNLDCLLSVLSGALSSEIITLPRRLKRIQCWAAGETATVAKQLLGVLRKRLKEGLGDSLAICTLDSVFSDPENFRSAIDGIEKFPCDEEGIAIAVSEMDKLLEKVNKKWNAQVQQEVIRWLCRFLLGRTCHDVSVLISFVAVDREKRSEALKQKLERLRFQSLDYQQASELVESDRASIDIWCRASIIDTDVKPYDKILEYADHFDNCIAAYWNRHGKRKREEIAHDAKSSEGAPTLRIQFAAKAAFCIVQRDKASKPPLHEAVGGHDDSVVFEDETVWKRMQAGVRGSTEFMVLRHFLEAPLARDIVPALVGIRLDNGDAFIGMKNILHGLQDPAQMDVKMGTRTWNTCATTSKAETQNKKAMESTTGRFGLRVVGGKMLNNAGQIERWSYKEKKVEDQVVKVRDIQDFAGLMDVFREFLCTPALVRTAIDNVEKVASFWDAETKYAFYASSLLFAYDMATKDVCRVGLIDFANAEQIQQKSEDLSGYNVGLDTVRRVLSALRH